MRLLLLGQGMLGPLVVGVVRPLPGRADHVLDHPGTDVEVTLVYEHSKKKKRPNN